MIRILQWFFLPRALIPAITEWTTALPNGRRLEESSKSRTKPRNIQSSDLKMMIEKADSQVKLACCCKSQQRRAKRTGEMPEKTS